MREEAEEKKREENGKRFSFVTVIVRFLALSLRFRSCSRRKQRERIVVVPLAARKAKARTAEGEQRTREREEAERKLRAHSAAEFFFFFFFFVLLLLFARARISFLPSSARARRGRRAFFTLAGRTSMFSRHGTRRKTREKERDERGRPSDGDGGLFFSSSDRSLFILLLKRQNCRPCVFPWRERRAGQRDPPSRKQHTGARRYRRLLAYLEKKKPKERK